MSSLRNLLLIIAFLATALWMDAPVTAAAPASDGIAVSDDPPTPPRRRGPRRRPDDAGKADAKPTDAKKDEKADEDEEEIEIDDTYLAVTGGIVHTVAGGTIAGATVVCKNGKILEIGRNVPVPEGAEVIDAAGMHVYPGLIAMRSSGLVDGGNPFAFNMTLGLAAGITTAVTGTSAAKLTFGTLEDQQLKSGLWESLSYDSSNPQGRKRLRESFERLRQHLRDVAAYEAEKKKDPEAKAPDAKWIRGQYATHMKLLKGEAKALMNISDTHQLLQACELAEQYGIEIVAQGAYEAWTVPERMGRAGMSVIVSPRQRVQENKNVTRPTGSSIETAAILRKHGVRVGIVPAGGMFGPGYQISLGGLAGRDLLHLPMAAAFAVRGGLSNQDALRTITIDAARILGVDDRVGSIEVGKDADFAITDGDLLHYMTHVNMTVVNGRVAYDKTKDTLFSHIRPAADPEAMPPDDYWPRRLGADW